MSTVSTFDLFSYDENTILKINNIMETKINKLPPTMHDQSKLIKFIEMNKNKMR